MEVHHSHHPSHKKKWHEYLLEFLMLFLAVFLGFLAENFREHKVEKHRAEQHLHTMVENLKYDTTRYAKNWQVNLRNILGLDSFRFQVNEAIEGRVDANRLYYLYIKYGRGGVDGIPILNEAALSQLKSSGLIRMIKNNEIVNEMGDYYSRRVTNLENAKNLVFQKRAALNESFKLFFSARQFDEIFHHDGVWDPGFQIVNDNFLNGIITKNPSLKLLPAAEGSFERLYSDLADLEWILGLYNAVIKYNQQGADSLIAHINREYGF